MSATPGLFHVKREPDFAAFTALLARWSGRINLVADPTPAVVFERHIADSLQLAPLLPQGDGVCADIGSGAGFPGLILAAATGRAFVLIESDRRKAAFLHEAAALLPATVDIRATRAETQRGLGARVVTARAVAAFPALLDLVSPLLAADGVLLALKGQRGEEELDVARAAWHFEVERFPSRTAGSTVFRLGRIRRRDAEDRLSSARPVRRT